MLDPQKLRTDPEGIAKALRTRGYDQALELTRPLARALRQP